jgi:hypothetical protein
MASLQRASSGAGLSPGRFLVALIAIPLFDTALAYYGFPILWWLGDQGRGRPVPEQQPAQAFALLAGGLGVLVMITVTAPMTIWLMRRGWTTIRHFALAGATAGNLPFALYLCLVLVFTIMHLIAGTLAEHLSPPVDLLAGAFRALLIGSLIGTASGVGFWLIAVRDRLA